MDQPTEDRTKKTEGTPNDILDHLKRIEEKQTEQSNLLKSLDQKLSEQSTLLTRINTRQDQHAELLIKHTRSINALETSVAALPTKEDLENLLRKYLRPGENGHKAE